MKAVTRTLRDSKVLLWALLALPAIHLMWRAATEGEWFDAYVPPSGEWAVRYLVVALSIGPLAALFSQRAWARWLLARRRSFGVACFAYSTLHVGFYVIDMANLADLLAEIRATGIWTGWLAFLLFLPLAVTSNNMAVRALGQTWKRLQRLAYPAAILVVVHWIMVHDQTLEALAWAAPVTLLRLWQLFDFRASPSVPKETSR